MLVANRQVRWLHTRISVGLEEALKREARRRRSPVSLVVRNVLESALDLVEDSVEDSMQVTRRSQRVARRVSRAQPQDGRACSREDLYGWQELILNRPAACTHCTTVLPPGEPAYRGLSDAPRGTTVFLCATCLRRLRPLGREQNEDVKQDRE